MAHDASVRNLLVVHAGRSGPVRVVNVSFAAYSGLKSDIVLSPKSADSVAKVPECLATNFPLEDETSDDR